MMEIDFSHSNYSWLVSASLCFALFTCTLGAGSTPQKPKDSSQPVKWDTVEYRVGRRTSITENSKPVLLIFVSIEPKHFVRDDMLKLARQLKQDFKEETRVRVDIFDDYRAASVWDPVHFHGLFQAAKRASYYRNSIDGKEFIEFSAARGKRRKRITLDK